MPAGPLARWPVLPCATVTDKDIAMDAHGCLRLNGGNVLDSVVSSPPLASAATPPAAAPAAAWARASVISSNQLHGCGINGFIMLPTRAHG